MSEWSLETMCVSASAPEPAQSADDVFDSSSRHAVHISKLAASKSSERRTQEVCNPSQLMGSSAQECCVPCIVCHGCEPEARTLGASPSIVSAAALDMASLADSAAEWHPIQATV